MKISIETYGCAANQAESEIMAGLLEKAGHEITEEGADLMVINTCHVKSVTEQKIIDRIFSIRKKLVVAGCMPEVYKEKILKANQDAVLVGTHQISNIVEAVEAGKSFLGPSGKEKLGLARVRKDKDIAIIEIADGCLGACNYCATRLAKGRLFSYRPSSIIKEIDCAINQGCKEVWMTAQDTGAYGKDAGTDLPTLLSLLPSGDYQVRIGMMNPNNVLPILERLVIAYEDPKIMKFLHMPVQSGDDGILKKMNRNYTVEQFEHIISTFREAFPEIKIWTDVIVGYPGETEEQFQNTLELLKRLRPDKVNISRFGKRDGTPAAKLKQFPTEELKRRTKETNKVLNRF